MHDQAAEDEAYNERVRRGISAWGQLRRARTPDQDGVVARECADAGENEPYPA